jgi:hypothetical protein
MNLTVTRRRFNTGVGAAMAVALFPSVPTAEKRDFEIAHRDVSLSVRRFREADRIVSRQDAQVAYSVIHHDESLHEWVYDFGNRDAAKRAFNELAAEWPDVPPGALAVYRNADQRRSKYAGA